MLSLPAQFVRRIFDTRPASSTARIAPRLLDCLEYEERTLFSATPAGDLVVAPVNDAGTTGGDAPAAMSDPGDSTTTLASESAADGDTGGTGEQSVASSDAADSDSATTSTSSSDSTDRTVREELVIIDSAVADAEALIADLLANDDESRHLNIVRLNADEDGIAQITTLLAQFENLSAIHFVTHATDGSLRLGGTWITEATFAQYADQIGQWRAALTDDADLLFYGCELAAGDDGRALLRGFEQLTGADVAASTDNTGTALFGGNWNFEFASGAVETTGAFSVGLQQNWVNLLTTTLDGVSTGVGNNSSTVTISHTTSGTNRLMLVAISFDPHDETVTSVTYNGTALSFVGSQQMPGDGDHSRVELWALVAPATGTHNVVVNVSGTDYNGFVVGVATFTGVNQTTPLINLASNYGSSSTASVTVTSQTDDLVFSVVHSHGNSSITPGAGQTEYWDVVDDGSNGAGTLRAGAASVANTWTVENDDWTAIGVSVQADTNSVVTAALSPVQDSYIRESAPTTNSGSATSMIVDREIGDLQRALVQFDLSSIPVGATIQSATLELQSTQIGGSLTINVYQLTESWVEGSTTWNESSGGSSWSTAGGTYNSTAVTSLTTSSTGLHSYNITSLAQAWVAGTQTNNGVILASLDGGGNRTVTYDTREGTTAPVLRIVYTMPANDAPVLDASKTPVLNSVTEDAGAPAGAVGTLVSSLVDFATPAGQVDNVTDPDAAASLGIAVTAADTTNGTWWYSTNNGTNWNALGAVTNTNARLLAADANTRIYFQPNADFDGLVENAITFRAWDQTTGSNGALADTSANGGTSAFSIATDSADITVNGVNDAPVNTVPGAQSVNEDSSLVFSSGNGNQISIADVDAAAGSMQVTLTVTNGALTLAGTTGLAFSVGDGTADGTMTFTGTITDINTALDGLAFTPTGNFNGAASLQIITNDQGNTGSGGAQSDTDSVAITVNAVNDPPVNTVPGAQSTNEDTALVFSAGNGNQISIADLDAAAGSMQVTLTVTNGTITLAGTTGLAFSVGDGTADGTMTFTGTITDINTALDGLTFTPTTNFNGAASLQIITNDQGNTGSGGAQSDTDSVAITVNAVNDAPVNTVPGAQSTNEDTALVFSAGNGNQISIADVDAAAGSMQVTLTVTNGTITLAGTTGLAFSVGDGTADGTMTFTGTITDINTALDGLTFTPTTNFNGAASLQIITNDQGNTGSGGAQSDTDSVAITVNAVNDAPTLGLPAAQETPFQASIVFSTAGGNGISIADVDAGGASVEVSLGVSHGVLTLSQTTGLTFVTGTGTNNATMVFQGSIADINAALDGLVYTPQSTYRGADALSLDVNDLGNSGIGGPQATSGSVNMSVAPAAQRVLLSAPDQQAATDFNAEFSWANGNPIYFTDVYAENPVLTVSIAANNGTFRLATVAGLTFTSGGQSGASMSFSGALSNVNAALNGAVFSGAGSDGSLSISGMDAPRDATGSHTAAVTISITQAPIYPSAPPVTSTDTDAMDTDDTNELTDDLIAPFVAPTARVAELVHVARVGVRNEAGQAIAARFINTPSERRDATEVDADVGSQGNAGDWERHAWRNASNADEERAVRRASHHGLDPTIPWSAIVFDERTADDDELQQSLVAGTAGVTAALSVGYALWSMRAASLLSTLVSSMPAWQTFDPLPVIEFSSRSPSKDEDDDSEDELFDSATNPS